MIDEKYRKVYLSELLGSKRLDLECLQTFETMCRRHLDDKVMYELCRSITTTLKHNIAEVEKEINNVRKTLNPRDTASRDGIRYRLAEHKAKDRNTGDSNQSSPQPVLNAIRATPQGDDGHRSEDKPG